MPKYTVNHIEDHRVLVIRSDEFDTSDKKKWASLKETVKGKMPDEEFESLPDLPPKDPLVWYGLYDYFDDEDYTDVENDWISARKGSYEIARELTDSKGKKIAS